MESLNNMEGVTISHTPFNRPYTVYNDSSVVTREYTYNNDFDELDVIRRGRKAIVSIDVATDTNIDGLEELEGLEELNNMDPGTLEGLDALQGADTLQGADGLDVNTDIRTIGNYLENDGNDLKDANGYVNMRFQNSIARELFKNNNAMKVTKGVSLEQLLSEEFYINLFKGEVQHDKLFQALTTRVITLRPLPVLEDRIRLTTLLTESYTDQVYEMPKSKQLLLLSNFILADTLLDSRPDQVSLESYPVLSNRQYDVRRRRELAYEFIETKSNTSLPSKKKNTMEYGLNK